MNKGFIIRLTSEMADDLDDLVRCGPYGNRTEAVRAAISEWINREGPIYLKGKKMDSLCKSCGAPIKWRLTELGKRIPLDAKPLKRFVFDDGAGCVRLVDTFTTHFANCPEAAKHRVRGK